MISVTRTFSFDAAHRVLGHKGKCRHLHGHRYVTEVTVRDVEDRLDNLGMVIDFSVLKTVVGNWIDQFWDHNIILNVLDPLLGAKGRTSEDIFGQKDPYIMEGNPTAENMAVELYQKVKGSLANYSLDIIQIRIYETPNCYADYFPFFHPQIPVETAGFPDK